MTGSGTSVTWICSALEGDGTRRDTTAANNTLTGGYRKQEGRSFSKVHRDRTRGTHQEAKINQKILIRYQNTVFHHTMVKYCNRLPR